MQNRTNSLGLAALLPLLLRIGRPEANLVDQKPNVRMGRLPEIPASLFGFCIVNQLTNNRDYSVIQREEHFRSSRDVPAPFSH